MRRILCILTSVFALSVAQADGSTTTSTCMDAGGNPCMCTSAGTDATTGTNTDTSGSPSTQSCKDASGNACTCAKSNTDSNMGSGNSTSTPAQ